MSLQSLITKTLNLNYLFTLSLLLKSCTVALTKATCRSNLSSEWSISAELCEVGGGRVVLSPRKLMMAMAHYIPNFNLTTQQVQWCLLNALTTLVHYPKPNFFISCLCRMQQKLFFIFCPL